MNQQVNATIQKQNDINAQSADLNRFLACEEIVEELVEQGLPTSFVPENFISRISKIYGISFQEAKTCLKLAVKQLEAENKQEEPKQEEKLYAQSGYFYPSGYSQNSSMTKPKDGMDSLSSLGSYNRLMFGLG
ncbi:MAG: hypothetical protein IKU37_00325 [Candidatus Gastranaerophilales bacterium]|nr:hypothetical protein [Candidatus Gastranaerophilales bacterium]